jgi:glycerophosphoryl diester phosphodiesterase
VIMVLGHRGMGVNYKYPGNTAESVLPAIGIGCDGAEIDIQLTKYSVLVLYHNHELDGRTNFTGSGMDYTWEELKICKYVALENPIYVQSVESLFDRIPNLTDYYFSFDCKMVNSIVNVNLYQERLARAIIRLCEKYKMADNIFIEGSVSFFSMARSLGLKNKCFLVQGPPSEAINIAEQEHCFGIGTNSSITKEEIELAHSKGLWVMMWGIPSENDNLIQAQKSPDIVQADKPIGMLKLFYRYNYGYVIP